MTSLPGGCPLPTIVKRRRTFRLLTRQPEKRGVGRLHVEVAVGITTDKLRWVRQVPLGHRQQSIAITSLRVKKLFNLNLLGRAEVCLAWRVAYGMTRAAFPGAGSHPRAPWR